MASILLNLDKSPSSDTVLAVDALGFVNEKWPKQIIEVWVNSKEVGKVTYSLAVPLDSDPYLFRRTFSWTMKV
jgi:hypothetical protein